MKTNMLETKEQKKLRIVRKAFQIMSAAVIAVVMSGIIAFAGNAGAIDTVINTLFSYLTPAFIAVGVIIAIWGIIQIVMAMRREDSEGISKNIITIVVGASVAAIGAFAPTLYTQIAGAVR